MDLQAFKYLLSSQGLKFTKGRRLVFEEIFSSAKVHSNAYEIHRKLRSRGEKVSLATIYRTLNLLVRSGIVSEIDLGEKHSHYEPEIVKAAHVHLICHSCGQVKEFSHEEIREIISKIGRENQFNMSKFSIQVFGLCKDCQNK